MTDPYAGYHKSVGHELDRQIRLGYTPEHDNEKGVDHLLALAYGYIAEGKTVKGGAMIIAARRWVQNNGHVNPMQRDIAKFMAACDQEVRKFPGLPEDEIVTLRIRLMVEELLGAVDPDEFTRDENGDYLRVNDGRYVELLFENKSDELIQSMLKGDLVGIADGIADVLYVVIGTAVAYGINIQEVFDEVQRSNMSKAVWDDDLKTYVVIKNEDGKVLKPSTFSEANIGPIISNQIVRGLQDVELVLENEEREKAFEQSILVLDPIAEEEDENAVDIVAIDGNSVKREEI